MDEQFFYNNKFNIKDIKELMKKLPKDKKISRESIINAYSYNAEKMQEVTDAMLTIFDNVDGSANENGEKNGELDYNELGLFLEKIEKAAGDDELSCKEAKEVTNSIDGIKEDISAPGFLFCFLRVLQVNMEEEFITDPERTINEVVVKPHEIYQRDSLYQKGQIVYITPSDNDFGPAKNWVELAKNLYRAEGYNSQDITSVEWNNRAIELRELNGNKDLADLNRIKIKLSNECINENRDKLENSYYNYLERIALPIAQKISSIVDNNQATDSMEKLEEMFNSQEINSENIVPLFYIYLADTKISNGDTSLIDAIMSETAITVGTRTEVRNRQEKLMQKIIDLLDEAATEAGVPEDIRAGFSSSLHGQLGLIFEHPDLSKTEAKWNDVNRANFEGAIKGYTASIIAAQKHTVVENPIELAQDFVTESKDTHGEISNKFQNYENSQGWFSDAVDTFTGWFGARTRKDIQELLDKYLTANGKNGGLKELQDAIDKKDYEKFKEAYKNCFGVPFDPSVIQARNEIGTKLIIVEMADAIQRALNFDSRHDILKQLGNYKDILQKEFKKSYGYDMNAASIDDIKYFLENLNQTYQPLSENILASTSKDRLKRDYERLSQSSPMLILQDQVESYMENQSNCVTCAEIIGDIAMTALLPGGSLMLLGKLGTAGKRAKTFINVISKVIDKSPKLALARNLTKTGAIVYANHQITYQQSAIESLKAAGEMSIFGLIGFWNSSLARLLIKGSGTFARLGQEAASMLGDATFMELYNTVLSGGKNNIATDLTQFMAIYILGKTLHSVANGNHKLTAEEKSLLENMRKELGINKPLEEINTKDLLKLANKKIKDTRLAKVISNALNPSVRDVVHADENFFAEFQKTGKPYDLAKNEDGTYVLRYKENTLDTGSKYTYCILDKDMKLIKKYNNMTAKEANSTIPNHRKLRFEYHAQKSNYLYVSFDAGLLENLAKKIEAKVKCVFLNRKLDKLNDLLNFYGIKEESFKTLSEAEKDTLIENLEVFEATSENISAEQLEAFSQLCQSNPDMTKDLATQKASEIARKIGIDKLDNGKKIISRIEDNELKGYIDEIESITTLEGIADFRARIDNENLPKRLIGYLNNTEKLIKLREFVPDEAEFNRIVESCKRKDGSIDQNKIDKAIKKAKEDPEIERRKKNIRELVPDEEEYNELVSQCKTALHYEQAENFAKIKNSIIKMPYRSEIPKLWAEIDNKKISMEQRQILRNMVKDLDYYYELNKHVKDPTEWNDMTKRCKLENGFIDIYKLDEEVTIYLFEGYINNAKTKKDCRMIRREIENSRMNYETRMKLLNEVRFKNEEVFDEEINGVEYFDEDFSRIRTHAYESLGIYDDRYTVGKARATGASNDIFEQLKSYNRELTDYAPNINALGESGIRGRNIVTLPQKVFDHHKKLGLKYVIDLRDDTSSVKINMGDVEHFIFPISYDGAGDDIVLKNMSGFVDRMNEGNFYIGCTQGSHRTDIAIALNFVLNKQCTYTPELLYVKRADVTPVIKRIYNKIMALTPEQRADYGMTEEFMKNFPASEAEVDSRILQVHD